MATVLDSDSILRGRYEIVQLVGQGGMGAVYRANDLRLDGRVCAIKEILPNLLIDQRGHGVDLGRRLNNFTRRPASSPGSIIPTCPRCQIIFPWTGANIW